MTGPWWFLLVWRADISYTRSSLVAGLVEAVEPLIEAVEEWDRAHKRYTQEVGLSTKTALIRAEADLRVALRTYEEGR